MRDSMESHPSMQITEGDPAMDERTNSPTHDAKLRAQI
jgi:hypothetical protein